MFPVTFPSPFIRRLESISLQAKKCTFPDFHVTLQICFLIYLQAEKHQLDSFARKERRFSSVESDLLRMLRPELHSVTEHRGKDEHAFDR